MKASSPAESSTVQTSAEFTRCLWTTHGNRAPTKRPSAQPNGPQGCVRWPRSRLFFKTHWKRGPHMAVAQKTDTTCWPLGWIKTEQHLRNPSSSQCVFLKRQRSPLRRFEVRNAPLFWTPRHSKGKPPPQNSTPSTSCPNKKGLPSG